MSDKTLKQHLQFVCRSALILPLLIIHLSCHDAYSQNFRFRTFTTVEGLPRYVYALSQDSLGNLWIGTDEGLSKYNGFRFENFNSSDSLADNFITCSITEGHGLWFGHMNGNVSFFDGNKFTGLKSDSTLSRITHMAKSPAGRLWMSSFADGLFELKRNILEIGDNIIIDGQMIHSFEFINERELLVGSASGLYHCILDDSYKVQEMNLVTEIPDVNISVVRKMRNGTGFYVATENDGLFRLTTIDSIEVLKINTMPELTGVQAFCEDSRSDLWIGTFGKGLIRLTDDTEGIKVKVYNQSTGFTTDNVRTIFEDREGSIWSGNFGDGLTQIIQNEFEWTGYDKDKYGSSVFSIFASGNIRWLGTEKGLLKTDYSTGKVIKFYSTASGLPPDTVTAVYSPDSKFLWIGTDKHGMFQLNMANDRIRPFAIGNGSLENSVTVITGQGNAIWAGTKKGLCSIDTTSGLVSWYTINQGGLPHNFINGLYPGSYNRLWISSKSNILAYIEEGKVNKIPINPATSMATLGSIAEDQASRLWIGSNGSGIFMLDSDSIVNLTTREGLFSDYCYSVLSDDIYIWVGHKGGLSRVNITDFTVRVVQQFENETDNFLFNSNAAFSDQYGKLCFGSDRGLLCHNPDMEYLHAVPPVLAIISIRVDNDEMAYPGNKRIKISPGSHRIRIDYLGSSLKDPGLVTYQSMLEGYDMVWSEITSSSYVTYPQLTEGSYRFILKASSGDGIVTPTPLEFSFFIATPLWKKWWFYAIVVLSLSILLVSYIKAREKTLLREKRILEEKVVERTQEILCQKNVLELQRDEIDKKNAHITSSILYALQIQQAILPHIELINKLLPENFLLNLPKDIVSGDFYWITRKNEKTIFAVADCTGHGVPGAFMSMLGITLLNEIVNIQGITRSDQIVTELRSRVIKSLQQRKKNVTTKDGMDIALCVLDTKLKMIQFTGGMNDLIYISNGNMDVIRADHLDVSISYLDCGNFNMQEFEYSKGDMIYLFSDGYQDQFGGEFDRKFLRPHFYTLLREVHKLPLAVQKETLEMKLASWMKNRPQTDDIIVLGIRL